MPYPPYPAPAIVTALLAFAGIACAPDVARALLNRFSSRMSAATSPALHEDAYRRLSFTQERLDLDANTHHRQFGYSHR